MDEIKLLRDRYYSAISLLQFDDDIMDALPKPNYRSFFSLIEGIIECLENDLKEWELLNQEKENNDIQYEITLLKRKIDLCLQLKAKAIQIDENETITLTNSFQNKRELIFARAKNGNSFIENDICALDQEYYLRIKNCLIELESGDLYSDNSQSKKIISNKKMAGIREIKKFKVRLYYRILSKNVVFVFLVRIKKDDNSKLDREIPQLRLMNTESEFQYYQGIMNGDDSALKEQLIQEHTSLKKQIFDYLNEHKRGERYV